MNKPSNPSFKVGEVYPTRDGTNQVRITREDTTDNQFRFYGTFRYPVEASANQNDGTKGLLSKWVWAKDGRMRINQDSALDLVFS